MFGQSSISYLGFLISIEDIRRDPQLTHNKIPKIKTLWLVPSPVFTFCASLSKLYVDLHWFFNKTSDDHASQISQSVWYSK